MDIVGDRKFVEIPGGKTHELPPLLLKTKADVNRVDKVFGVTQRIVEDERLVPDIPLDLLAKEEDVARRKYELALNLTEQYYWLTEVWQWGDGILEWIRQCETTFENRLDLRPFLKPDVWPHAGRSSFVTLLRDKGLEQRSKNPLHKTSTLESCVGLRLTFRQPPPIRCFSDQFLFYLNGPIAASAYRAWANISSPEFSLPPERFTFQVIDMSLE